MFHLISGILLGWGLGANDSSNVFGTAVMSRMIRYSTAIVLTAIFVMIGAITQGSEGIKTITSLSTQTLSSAFIVSTAAAITVIVMTILKLPISTSQAVIGAIIGSAVMTGGASAINISELIKIVICWFATPVGAMGFTFLFYYFFRWFFRTIKADMVSADGMLRTGLIIAGCYGAFALGANNVANVTGVYVGTLLTVNQAVVIGGISIASGVLTYGRNVMQTVGKGIVPLDAFSAFITVVAEAVTVHIFAIIGVPVSTSQAIVGAVIGIGLIRNVESINFTVAAKVFSGWFFTPLTAFAIAFLLNFIFHLKLVIPS